MELRTVRCGVFVGKYPLPSTHLSPKTKTVVNQGSLKCTYHYYMERGRGEQVDKKSLKNKNNNCQNEPKRLEYVI